MPSAFDCRWIGKLPPALAAGAVMTVSVALAQPDLNAMRTAAEGGNPTAQFWYADRLHATAATRAEALTWFRRAADQGHTAAQASLARLLERGEDGAADPVEARRYYRLASAGGSIPATFNLALMLDEGRGGARDAAEAAALYRKVAATGHARAANNLATLLLKGDGIPADRTEAEHWYRLAAKAGLADAYYNLGVMWAAGPEPDIAAAHAWFTLASELPDNRVKALAEAALKALEPNLTPELVRQSADRQQEYRRGL